MRLYLRGDTWWYSFEYAGKRVQESARTTRKTIASEVMKKRRLELERAHAGLPSTGTLKKIISVNDVINPYLEHYGLNHRPQSTRFATGRLDHVRRLIGNVLLPDLTEERIKGYIRSRHNEGVSGRTINMELGELSRSIGQPWSVLWPKVRKLEERKDVGHALTPDEQSRLISALDGSSSPLLPVIVQIALLTGMRAGEIFSLTWDELDILNRRVTVGRAKTSSGTGRTIPMKLELVGIVCSHRIWFTSKFGEPRPDLYVLPSGAPVPNDPSKPVREVKRAWATLRRAAKVKCRMHDLRHTVATRMAEAGVPESTMLALLGHMSRAMLERYSHIRWASKHAAVESLSITPEREFSVEVTTKTATVGNPTAVQ